MKKINKLTILILAFFIVGCASVTLIKPGRITIGDTISVQLIRDWTRIQGGKMEVWTIDGSLLHAIHFLIGAKDGSTIFDARGEQKFPRYKVGMTPLEIADLIKGSLAVSEIRNFKITKLRPYSLGGLDGFRFEFRYTEKAGLEMKGFVVGAVQKEKLNLIFYSGARIHYFSKYENNAEDIVKSVKFLKARSSFF